MGGPQSSGGAYLIFPKLWAGSITSGFSVKELALPSPNTSRFGVGRGGGLGAEVWANVEIEPDIASHTDVLTGSSRNHSSPTNVRGAGTRDEPLLGRLL